MSVPETVDDEMAMKVRRNRQAGPKHRADTGMFRLWRGLGPSLAVKLQASRLNDKLPNSTCERRPRTVTRILRIF